MSKDKQTAGQKKAADPLVRIQPRIPQTLVRRVNVHAATTGVTVSDVIASVLDSALPPLAEKSARK